MVLRCVGVCREAFMGRSIPGGVHYRMNRPVLITGCSSGIGLATTRYLAERDVPVYATVRTEHDAERLREIQGVEAFLCDVTSDEQVRSLREVIDARGKGLWAVVHNAGILKIGSLAATAVDDLRALLEVNVVGVHRVTNALVDLVVESGGRIVTMSSIAGTLSGYSLGGYSMTKHALEAYTDTLAEELAPRGVHVCAVVPGNFDSAISRNAVNRFAPPADASESVKALWEAGADLSRSRHPDPEPVAEACFAALFDEEPRSRYLVVPNRDEADLTLLQAVYEWDRLNTSSPHAWSMERLRDEIAESGKEGRNS